MVPAFLRRLLTLARGVTLGLSEESAGNDPIALFGRWFDAARKAGIPLYEAVVVATATKDAVPSARTMLLKGHGEDGFLFFTDYRSRKAIELDENPKAALVFHWPALQRQIRVEGVVEKLSGEASAAYFQSRPRGSRIGAWASVQSTVLANREQLEQRVRKREREFAGRDVPLPPFWGGFRVTPVSIEFWQGRINRLHDRVRFTKEAGRWRRQRLAP